MSTTLTPEQAKVAANRLLLERRLSKWTTGFLRGVQPHTPTASQIEIISRLVKQHGLDLDSKYEVSEENTLPER
jgi:hypothetical protein